MVLTLPAPIYFRVVLQTHGCVYTNWGQYISRRYVGEHGDDFADVSLLHEKTLEDRIELWKEMLPGILTHSLTHSRTHPPTHSLNKFRFLYGRCQKSHQCTRSAGFNSGFDGRWSSYLQKAKVEVRNVTSGGSLSNST